MIWKKVGSWPDGQPVRRELTARLGAGCGIDGKPFERTLASVTELRGSSGEIRAFMASLANGKGLQIFYDWPQAKAWCDGEVALLVLAEAA